MFGKKGAREPMPPQKLYMVLGGLAAAVIGLSLLLYGLAPLGKILDVMASAFSDPGAVDADSIEKLGPQMQERVVFDVLGFILFLGGIIVIKMAAKPPKPKSVEQLVEEKVNERIAQMQAQGLAPTGAPTGPTAPAGRPVPPQPLQPVATKPAPAGAPVVFSRSPSCKFCKKPLVPGSGLCGHCGSFQ